MYFIFGNYGDNTIAVIQWAKINQLQNVTVVHVDTGWGADSWRTRVKQGQHLAKNYQFEVVELKPNLNFADLVRDRKSFPNAKFQWCSTFLKALPFNSFLDQVDPSCQSTVVLGSQRHESRARSNLLEFINESEHYSDRKVWYPLFDITTETKNKLISDAGFEKLDHPSLECFPCIHSSINQFANLDKNKIQQINLLEQEVNETFFHSRYPQQTLANLVLQSKINSNAKEKTIECFDMGCGSYYVCGE